MGAHYDTVLDSPGADDNASGVAALLAIARELASRPQPPARTVRLVAFANEEPPHFQTPRMGSLVYARRARERGDRIVAMLSLESIGYYSDAPGSQRYPLFLLGWIYPSRGDFLAFVGDVGARALVRRAIASFRRHAALPSEGAAVPGFVPGVLWSDHWSFREAGYPAIMVTGTAPFRNPHYHEPSDRPETLDYDRLARATAGLARVIDALAAGP